MLRIPNPRANPCPECGELTVLAEHVTGLYRVHCGTYRYSCPQPKADPQHAPPLHRAA